MGSEAAVFTGSQSSCVLFTFALQTSIFFVCTGGRFPDQTLFEPHWNMMCLTSVC